MSVPVPEIDRRVAPAMATFAAVLVSLAVLVSWAAYRWTGGN